MSKALKVGIKTLNSISFQCIEFFQNIDIQTLKNDRLNYLITKSGSKWQHFFLIFFFFNFIGFLEFFDIINESLKLNIILMIPENLKKYHIMSRLVKSIF
jgi:hypothetical protein